MSSKFKIRCRPSPKGSRVGLGIIKNPGSPQAENFTCPTVGASVVEMSRWSPTPGIRVGRLEEHRKGPSLVKGRKLDTSRDFDKRDQARSHACTLAKGFESVQRGTSKIEVARDTMRIELNRKFPSLFQMGRYFTSIDDLAKKMFGGEN
ncbi:hypothetical protein C8R44DRAFT_755029 [Mycena epipterygia]|nr:hypothetical protein C8R44DRAFT_755029 [Mycena epipterygia]